MSMKNTYSLPQYPRNYSIQLSTANTNYTAPVTPGLLWVAGPDGSDIWNLSVIPTATVTTANQMQFFTSPDGGTTFNFILSGVMPTYTMAQTTAAPVLYIPHPNGVPLGPTNPLILTGVTDIEALTYAQSTLSEPTTSYFGGVTQGTANAQTCPYAFNSALAILGTTPATGTVIDFEAGSTNTAACTLVVGNQTGTPSIKRASGTALSAGDLTKGFRYRAWWDGTEWILLLTQRLYFAQGQAQATVATAWGADR